MDVALLNVKITFQKNSVEVDAIGNHKNGWADYYTCHATVSGESGNEKHTAGTTVEDSDLAFTIRWCRKAAEIDVTGYRVALILLHQFQQSNHKVFHIYHLLSAHPKR